MSRRIGMWAALGLTASITALSATPNKTQLVQAFQLGKELGITQNQAVPLIIQGKAEAFKTARKANPNLTPEQFLAPPPSSSSSSSSSASSAEMDALRKQLADAEARAAAAAAAAAAANASSNSNNNPAPDMTDAVEREKQRLAKLEDSVLEARIAQLTNLLKALPSFSQRKEKSPKEQAEILKAEDMYNAELEHWYSQLKFPLSERNSMEDLLAKTQAKNKAQAEMAAKALAAKAKINEEIKQREQEYVKVGLEAKARIDQQAPDLIAKYRLGDNKGFGKFHRDIYRVVQKQPNWLFTDLSKNQKASEAAKAKDISGLSMDELLYIRGMLLQDPDSKKTTMGQDLLQVIADRLAVLEKPSANTPKAPTFAEILQDVENTKTMVAELEAQKGLYTELMGAAPDKAKFPNADNIKKLFNGEITEGMTPKFITNNIEGKLTLSEAKALRSKLMDDMSLRFQGLKKMAEEIVKANVNPGANPPPPPPAGNDDDNAAPPPPPQPQPNKDGAPKPPPMPKPGTPAGNSGSSELVLMTKGFTALGVEPSPSLRLLVPVGLNWRALMERSKAGEPMDDAKLKTAIMADQAIDKILEDALKSLGVVDPTPNLRVTLYKRGIELRKLLNSSPNPTIDQMKAALQTDGLYNKKD